MNSINDLELFLQKIGFKSNKRHDFDKHFYSIIGLLAKKINYGVTDKKVIDFAQKVTLPITNQNLIENMINNINKITTNDDITIGNIESSNVRSTKYLLVMLAYNYINVNENMNQKLSTFSMLNDKFSVFNSAKEGEIEKAFAGFNQKVIDDFRNITLISKASHNLEDVSRNMKKLGYYVEHFYGADTIPYQD